MPNTTIKSIIDQAKAKFHLFEDLGNTKFSVQSWILLSLKKPERTFNLSRLYQRQMGPIQKFQDHRSCLHRQRFHEFVFRIRCHTSDSVKS